MDPSHVSMAHRTSPTFMRLSTRRPNSTESSLSGTPSAAPGHWDPKAGLGALSLLMRGCRNGVVSHKKRRPQTAPVVGRRFKDAWQLGRGIAPAVHSWYAYRYHEDASSWEGGLAMVALTSMIASPFFLPMLFSSCESSPASLESSDKKKRSLVHADASMAGLRFE